MAGFEVSTEGGTRGYIQAFSEDPKYQSGFLLYSGSPNELPQWLTDQTGPTFHREVLLYEDDASVIRFLRR
jgi:hypothetical protein